MPTPNGRRRTKGQAERGPAIKEPQALRRRLLAWYARHARDLPWRRTRDPYLVWVSEIMLQQTQVATVAPYFERFTERFPSIDALARAGEQEVLRVWEGLGYYRRARQMHQAARILACQHGGQFPRDIESVLRLPGIGRYTAGAILSIAFNARLPILEANTQRLLSRLVGYPGDPGSAAGQRVLWAVAEAVLPRRGAGRLNQALMELGSQVCSPKAPRCERCPVATLCQACAQGIQSCIPPPKAKPLPEIRHEAAVVVRRGGRVLLVRCAEQGRWAGLWDFPRFHVVTQDHLPVERQLVDLVRRQTGVVIGPGSHLVTLKHAVTRFRITLDCYQAPCLSNRDLTLDPDRLRWLRPSELEAYPLSTTGRKLSRLISG